MLDKLIVAGSCKGTDLEDCLPIVGRKGYALKIKLLDLQVTNADALAEFYHRHLGMPILKRDDKHVVIGYTQDNGLTTGIALRQIKDSHGAYRHRRNDVYWKIGIALADVAEAARQLRARGVAVSDPRQFRDIGFLCHLEDPEGFQIELLQHRFEANFSPAPPQVDHPLGSRPGLGQVTLRAIDIEANLRFYGEGLGMRLLSVQPLEDLGFSLYFLAFTEEQPPQPALQSVANREWLWQRPYTTLEIQHLWGQSAPAKLILPDPGEPGPLGLTMAVSDRTRVLERLNNLGFGRLEAKRSEPVHLRDPQGLRIKIE